jgi:Tol biopolymer transport system component
MKLILYCLELFIFISIITGCKESSNPIKPYVPQPIPVLKDSIPYGSMGQGKIVFERIGPVNNDYEGGYVLDINNHNSSVIHSGIFDGPSISPDGKLVAFSALNMDGITYYDIYTIKIDGSNLTEIIANDGQDNFPSWSINSDYIYSFNLGIPDKLYQTSLPSHNSTVVFSPLTIESPASVAADGRILYSDIQNIKVWQNNSISSIRTI